MSSSKGDSLKSSFSRVLVLLTGDGEAWRPTAPPPAASGIPGGERGWSGSSAKWPPRRGGSREFTR